MAIIPIKLVKVQANGKRYILLREDLGRGKVYVKGDVLRVSGHSATHGPNRCFLRNRVDILDVDMTEETLQELLAEAGVQAEPAPAKALGRKKWVKVSYDGHNMQLTDYGIKQLVSAGYDMGRDGLGDYISADDLESPAADLARGHPELDFEGVPRQHIIRELAADYIHEGLLKAAKEKGLG